MFLVLLVVVAAALLGASTALARWRRAKRGYSLRGKVCVLTGAGRGLGREIAELLARGGELHGLALWDIRKADVDEVAEQLRGVVPAGSRLKLAAFGCDVSSPDSVARAAAETRSALGEVDVVVNNAGIVTGRPFLQLSAEQMQRTMAVNSQAHWWLLRELLPHMLRRNDGQIVTVASVMADMPACGLSDYCASKAAAAAFHHVLRLELRKAGATGVRTTLVCPYAITTGMFSGIRTAFQRLVPHLDPRDVARAVVDAVADGQQLVYLPAYFGWLIAIFRLLPLELLDPITEFAGGRSGMDTFQGRGIDFAMAKESDRQ